MNKYRVTIFIAVMMIVLIGCNAGTHIKLSHELAFEQSSSELLPGAPSELLFEQPSSELLPGAFPEPLLIEQTSKSVVVLNQQPSAVTSNFRVLTPAGIDKIEFAFYSEEIFCINNKDDSKKEQKYGFIHINGTEITPYIYDYAYPFNEGLACVRQGKKFGFINKDGEIAIPFIYDNATSFSNGLAYFEKNDTYGFIDKNGNTAFLLDCDSVSSFQDERAFFSIHGKYGYIDTSGKEVIPPQFDDVGYFVDGLAKVKVGNSFGFIDKDGEFVIEPIYDDITVDGDYFRIKSDDFIGVIDSSGEVILPPEYSDVTLLPGAIAVNDDKGEGKILMSYDGTTKASERYDLLFYNKGDELISTSIDGKWGYLDATDLSVAIPFIYDSASDFIDGFACIRLDGEYAIIDTHGNVIVPFHPGFISIFSNGTYAVSVDGGRRLMDVNGRSMNDTLFDTIWQSGDGYSVSLDGSYSFLDSSGKEFAKKMYDSCEEIYEINNCFIASIKDNSTQNIIVLGEPEEADLSGIVLRNEITPRIMPFSQLLSEKRMEVDPYLDYPDNSEFIHFYKLYQVADKTVLYYFSKPVHRPFMLPLSYSGFYSVSNGQLSTLVTGEQCGGTLGGDYICFWNDKQTGEVYMGTYYYHRAYGGSAYGGYVYTYSKGRATPLTSFGIIMRTLRNYKEDYLLENADTIYNQYSEPYNKDTILQEREDGGDATEYFINDNPTTIDAYHEITDRYSKQTLWLWPGY